MKIDLNKVCDLKFDGIKHSDAPNYCDAYISEGWIEIPAEVFVLLPVALTCSHNHLYFRKLTEEELDYLNGSECGEWLYEKLMRFIY